MPPSKAVPSISPSKSISSESPSAAARSTGSSRAKPSRMRSISVSTISSCDLLLFAPDLEAPVLAELGRRPHPDLELEGQRLALGLGGRDHLDAGVADRADPGVEQRPLRTTPAAPRGSPPRAPGRSRAAGSPARAAPCPCGSRASASPWPSPGRRGRRRARRPRRATSTSTRTRESGSSVTRGLHRRVTLDDRPVSQPRPDFVPPGRRKSSARSTAGEGGAQGDAEVDREGEPPPQRPGDQPGPRPSGRRHRAPRPAAPPDRRRGSAPRGGRPWPAATARWARCSSRATPWSMGEVEQPLLLDPLLRRLEEEPGEHAEAEEGALDHHDHAGDALVGRAARCPIRRSPGA